MAGVMLLDLDCDRVVGPSGGAAILPGCKNDANLGIGGNGDDCVVGGAEGSCVTGGAVTGANGGGTADGAGGAGGGPTVMPPVVPVELVAVMPV